MKPSTLARQIRSVYPTFFAAPIVCLLASVYFVTQRYFAYAIGFVVMAGMLLPPMWMCYKSSRKNCEEAITAYDEYMAAPAGKEALLRPSSGESGDRVEEMLRPAKEEREAYRETLLRQPRDP